MLGNERAIYLKASPNLQVIYVEKWREVVLASHGGASHCTFSETLKELKQDWVTHVRDYGITSEYKKALISHCGCQLVSKVNPNNMLGASIAKYNKTLPIEVIKVESLKLDNALTDLQTKYHTCLRKGAKKGV